MDRLVQPQAEAISAMCTDVTSSAGNSMSTTDKPQK
jgi:hypothetical protein